MEGNDNFYFLSFSAFPYEFWLEKAPYWYFLIFSIFCYFFGIFYYALGRNETERKFLFSLFLSLFHPILAWNEAIMIFFNFLNFVAIFLEFSIMRCVGTEWNGMTIFIFSLSLPSPINFGLKRRHIGIF